MAYNIRFTIESIRDFAGEAEFGSVGAYERIDGKVNLGVSLAEAQAREIVDADRIERDEYGLITSSAQFTILRPKVAEASNGKLLYEVNNRGNKYMLRAFNDAPLHSDGSLPNDPLSERDVGNGFLFREGYTLVWSGWQGDLLAGGNRLTLDLPGLVGGENIHGWVRTELTVDDEGVFSLPLSGNNFTRSYEAVMEKQSEGVLTCRERGTDARVEIPTAEWAFEKLESNGTWGPSAGHCRVKSGFCPGWLYELVYIAKNPAPLGLGFIAVQGFVSWLMNEARDSFGNANPLYNAVSPLRTAYGWGCSQCARFLREFVYRGYNEDAVGRQVFQGLLLHVSGGGRVTLNYRFAQPGRHPRQHQDNLFASDEFPFAYPVTRDHLTDVVDGILKRSHSDPFVIHTQTSAEYWERRGSLVHTLTNGNDLPDHEKSRCYLFASAPHDASPHFELIDHHLVYPRNRLRTSCFERALLIALDAWVNEGVQPPDSNVPRRGDGTGLTASEIIARMPKIPGLQTPFEENRLFLADFGDRIDEGIFSVEPPPINREKEYALLLPAIDEDGLEVVGLRSPYVSVPLATYFGWNLRAHTEGARVLSGVMGSYIPFARTEQEAALTGDPRPPVTRRYPSDQTYIAAIRDEAERLVRDRVLLQEDADRFVAAARISIGLLPAAAALIEPQISWDVARRPS